MLGTGTSTNLPFSLTAESLLLKTLTVPAHFVALNGDKLNINLKTGTEVRVSGLGCSGEMGFPWTSPRMSLCLLQLWWLSASDPWSPLLPGLAELPGVPWACSFRPSLLFYSHCSGQNALTSSPKKRKCSPT